MEAAQRWSPRLPNDAESRLEAERLGLHPDHPTMPWARWDTCVTANRTCFMGAIAKRRNVLCHGCRFAKTGCSFSKFVNHLVPYAPDAWFAPNVQSLPAPPPVSLPPIQHLPVPWWPMLAIYMTPCLRYELGVWDDAELQSPPPDDGSVVAGKCGGSTILRIGAGEHAGTHPAPHVPYAVPPPVPHSAAPPSAMKKWARRTSAVKQPVAGPSSVAPAARKVYVVLDPAPKSVTPIEIDEVADNLGDMSVTEIDLPSAAPPSATPPPRPPLPRAPSSHPPPPNPRSPHPLLPNPPPWLPWTWTMKTAPTSLAAKGPLCGRR
ncbi:hypothetical protein OF83DRAFT_1180874, partial [Amylostereum chailletii]